MRVMFLDDIRNLDYLDKVTWANCYSNLSYEEFQEASKADITLCRSVKEAKSYILSNGVPDVIFFDHDLGINTETGLVEDSVEFVNWLIESDYDQNYIPRGFKYLVHSSNPVGAKNLASKVDGYLSFKFS